MSRHIQDAQASSFLYKSEACRPTFFFWYHFSPGHCLLFQYESYPPLMPWLTGLSLSFNSPVLVLIFKHLANLLLYGWIVATITGQFTCNFKGPFRGGSRGRVQGVRTPSWDEVFFFVFAFKLCLSHRSVTSFLRGARPPKKNPGSAPAFKHTLL